MAHLNDDNIEDVEEEVVTSARKKTVKASDDPLLTFLSGIKDLSDAMKKRVHKVLSTEGIVDPRGIKALTKRELENLPGISDTTAILLRDQFEAKSEGSIFLSLEEREELEVVREKIKTGAKALDTLLQGGVPTGIFCELYGAPQSGKTQICYSLSANTLLPKDFGGLDSGVIWIDTEGSFNSQRLKQVLAYYEYTYNIPKGQLNTSRFLVAAARTLAQIEQAIKEAGRVITKNNVKLLIVDSLMDPFRSEYGGLGELANRQKHLNRLLHSLMRIAEAYDLAVVYTNQVMANPDPFATAMDKIQPVGGFVLGHASDIRIWLRRATSKIRNQYDAPNARRALITDCGWLPQNECHFSLGAFGITDVEEEANHRKLSLELDGSIGTPADEEEEEVQTDFVQIE
ncbi:MAG: AAA family ATPase [Candidatus Heimdallarchaeota archaeon]|nr:AAA family ATPase [Candidatus Heimdallarchaeota archaeon]